MKAYKTQQAAFGLPKGTIFVHVPYNSEQPDLGNIGCGALVLAWNNGDCQAGWAGGAFCLPGQLADDNAFFREAPDKGNYTWEARTRHTCQPKSNVGWWCDVCGVTNNPTAIVCGRCAEETK